MANISSCSHHAIGKEVSPLKNFSSVGIHRSRFEFGALGLVLIISPSSELGIAYHFFMDSLFFKEYSVKILNFFSTGWQPVQPVRWANLHRALILVILELKSYMARGHKLQIGLG